MKTDLDRCPNLGSTIQKRLKEIGVETIAELRAMGSVRAYQQLCERAGRRMPACYYLYSLEGALRGIHWDDLSKPERDRLRREAGLAVR